MAQRALAPCLVLASMACRIFSVSGYEFHVSGFVKFEQFDEVGRTNSEPDCHFEISVKDSKWFLRMEMEKDATFYYPYDYQEISWDGHYLYYVSPFEKQLKARQERGEPVGPNVATAWIYATPILHTTHAHQSGIVWLAYASASYLQKIPSDQIEPVVAVGLPTGIYPEHWKLEQKAAWNLLPREPRVPKDITYFDDGLVRSPFERSGKPLGRRDPPYDKGFTNVLYKVLELLDIDHMLLPKQAELETFCLRPVAASKTLELQRINRYALEGVTFLPTCNVASFVPRLPEKTVVSDARFAQNGAAFSYMSGKWLSESEAKNTVEFKRQMGVTPPVHPRVVLLLILCLFLGPIVIGYAKTRTTRCLTTQPK